MRRVRAIHLSTGCSSCSSSPVTTIQAGPSVPCVTPSKPRVNLFYCVPCLAIVLSYFSLFLSLSLSTCLLTRRRQLSLLRVKREKEYLRISLNIKYEFSFVWTRIYLFPSSLSSPLTACDRQDWRFPWHMCLCQMRFRKRVREGEDKINYSSLEHKGSILWSFHWTGEEASQLLSLCSCRPAAEISQIRIEERKERMGGKERERESLVLDVSDMRTQMHWMIARSKQ